MMKYAIPTLLLAGALMLGCATTQAATPATAAPDAEELAVAQTLSLAGDLWECIQVNKAYRYEVFAVLISAGASKTQADELLNNKEAFLDDTLKDIHATTGTLADIEEYVGFAELALEECRAEA